MRAPVRILAYMPNNSPPQSYNCGRCDHHCDAQDDRLVYDVPDVMRILGIKSRRTVEKLIRTGELKSYMVTSLRKIDRAAVEDYLKRSVAPEYLDAHSRRRAKAS